MLYIKNHEETDETLMQGTWWSSQRRNGEGPATRIRTWWVVHCAWMVATAALLTDRQGKAVYLLDTAVETTLLLYLKAVHKLLYTANNAIISSEAGIAKRTSPSPLRMSPFGSSRPTRMSTQSKRGSPSVARQQWTIVVGLSGPYKQQGTTFRNHYYCCAVEVQQVVIPLWLADAARSSSSVFAACFSGASQIRAGGAQHGYTHQAPRTGEQSWESRSIVCLRSLDSWYADVMT